MKKIKRSEKYYIDRFVKQENIAHELSLTKQKQLKSVYREASKELETELAFFIERYSKENELTPADLKRMLNTKEKANFRYSVKKYVEEIERLGADTKEGKALKKELDILAGRTRISRKEELIATLNAELSKTSMKVSKTIGEHLKDVASFGYKDSFLIMSNTLAKLDTKLLERIVAQKWSGKNYSDRIWKNKNNLVKRLVKNITVGLAQGFEFKKMSSRLARDLDIGFYEARRIIETETTGALENAKAQAFKDMGVSKYKFVATLDDRTSEICRSLNGQVFEMKDRQVGINCPFCHPFCRSITIPVVDKKAEKKIQEIKTEKETENNQNSLKNENKNGIIKYKEVDSKIEKQLQNKSTKLWENKLLVSEQNALYEYSNSDYLITNRYLRNALLPDDDIEWNQTIPRIKELDRVLSNNTLGDNLILHRGVSFEEFKCWENSNTFDTYKSTSIYSEVTDTFDSTYKIKIRAPKDTKGFYIGNNSRFSSEKEFLLHRSQKYKILELKETFMEVEIID